jgi:hypothetical protein
MDSDVLHARRVAEFVKGVKGIFNEVLGFRQFRSKFSALGDKLE